MSLKIEGSGMKPRMLGDRLASIASRPTPRASSNCVTRSSGWNPGSRASAAKARQRHAWPRKERVMPATLSIAGGLAALSLMR